MSLLWKRVRYRFVAIAPLWNSEIYGNMGMMGKVTYQCFDVMERECYISLCRSSLGFPIIPEIMGIMGRVIDLSLYRTPSYRIMGMLRI